MSGFIINPHIMATAGGGGSTTKYQVRQADFDADNSCECSLSDTYLIVEDDGTVDVGGMGYGADLSPSVDDWISIVDANADVQCAQVTAINQTGTAVGITSSSYADCDECNSMEMVCEEGL